MSSCRNKKSGRFVSCKRQRAAKRQCRDDGRFAVCGTTRPRAAKGRRARRPQTFDGVPYLEDSYVGNGTVPYAEWRALGPVMGQFLEIGKGDLYEPALRIMARTYTPPEMAKYGRGSLPYLPFIYAKKVLGDLRKKVESQEYRKLVRSGQIDEKLTMQMIKEASLATSRRDNEWDEEHETVWIEE